MAPEPDHASRAAITAAKINAAGVIIAGALGVLAACISAGWITFSAGEAASVPTVPTGDGVWIDQSDANAIGLLIFIVFVILVALVFRDQIKEWWYLGR